MNNVIKHKMREYSFSLKLKVLYSKHYVVKGENLIEKG